MQEVVMNFVFNLIRFPLTLSVANSMLFQSVGYPPSLWNSAIMQME